MRLRGFGFLLVAALALGGAGAPAAQAFSLASLVAGGSFSSSNGSLQFSGFDAVVTGDLSPNLDSYELLPMRDGFRVVGPVGVADGEIGDLLLSYSVVAAQPGLELTGASLFANTRAAGAGSSASVSEDLLAGGAPLASLFVFATGGGGFEPLASSSFRPQAGAVAVVTDIQVDSSRSDGRLGGIAAISLVKQQFAVIPEPATLLLVSLGAGGLVLLGRRRPRA